MATGGHRSSGSSGRLGRAAEAAASGGPRAGIAAVHLVLFLVSLSGPGAAGGAPRRDLTELAALTQPSISAMVRGVLPPSTCDDGNPCTQVDTCVEGRCVGGEPLVCAPVEQCHDIGRCNPLTSECTTVLKRDGAACDDGGFCTIAETCTAGVCGGGTLRNCSDGNVCSADLCDEDMDRCIHNPIAPCCGNGLVDEGEGCDAGAGNSDAPDAACRTDCTPRRCGDGVVDEERAEQCDDGNLDPGDGCSPRCFWEPTAAATAVDGVGNQKTECVIGWRAEGIIGAKQESPTPRRRCVDGNPACDRDGAVNGECAFWVWLCSNTTQLADLPCHPSAGRDGVGTVAIAQVRKPSAKHASRRSVDAGNHRLLLEAAAAAAVGENIDVCGPRLTIRIPLRASERRGWRSIRVKATTNQNVIDTDSLKLICVAPEAPTLEAEVTPPSAPAGRLAPMREVTEPSE